MVNRSQRGIVLPLNDIFLDVYKEMKEKKHTQG